MNWDFCTKQNIDSTLRVPR